VELPVQKGNLPGTVLATTLLWVEDGTRWLQSPFSQHFHGFVVGSSVASRSQQALKYDNNMRKLDHTSQKLACRSPGMDITVTVTWAAGRVKRSWQFTPVPLLGYGLHTEPNAACLMDFWFTQAVQASAFPARLVNAPFQIS